MHQTGFSLRLGRLCALALCLSSTAASAAGLLLPDNGTNVLGRGGTAVGFLDTADALQFNPAGMTTGDGLDVRLDMRLANPGESFQPAGQSVVTKNTSGVSPGPQAEITYHPAAPIARMFAFGLGVWAPPGILAYNFPDPNNYKGEAATSQTPQRYNLISQATTVVYPTIGVAFSPIKFISVGADLQYIYSNTQLTEDLQGLPASYVNTPGVTNDVRAAINVTGQPRLSGIFGLLLRPLGDLVPDNDLVISASYRPEQPITEDGSLNIGLGSEITSDLPGLTVKPDPASAVLQIKLPPILRVGANYKWKRLAISVEWVFEQWDVNNSFLLTTNAQICSSPTGACKNPLGGSPAVAPIQIVNDWHNASSIRGGLGYDFLRPKEDGYLLQVNLGALYEGNAIPYASQSLPFITGNQTAFSAGAQFAFHGFGIAASFMYYLPQNFTVSDSIVKQGSAVPESPVYIGNGNYTTNYWVVSMGLSYHLPAS